MTAAAGPAAQAMVEALARELLEAWDTAQCVPLHTARPGGLDVAQAYGVARRVQQMRLARGERPCGWKIGFTNRGIWDRYGVHQPMWAPVWDSTLTLLEGTQAVLSLRGLCQPRLEPEIAFGIARAPRAGMTLDELRGCLSWVAHGFEVVHTHYAGWRFAAADCALDFGLHGRLLVGPRTDTAGWDALASDLAALDLHLHQGGALVESGRGAIVLDGPLQALRALVESMAVVTPHWALAPGDVVTTGTITDAQPLVAGQRWHTMLSEPRLSGLTLDVVD